MKNETMNTTTNSRIYKLLLKKYLSSNEGLCPICSPHKGCNYWNNGKPHKNWKYFRKNKWKGPDDRGTAS